MKKTIFALVDCNNFFCSCERVFDPKLNNIPLAVLSSNDGCIIARSKEVKDLGIPMGAPYHEYKRVILDNNVKVVSSNFQLYGDMSNRVMSILKMLCPDVEVYSVDEAFLRFDGFDGVDLFDYCKYIRAIILKWSGIPVSIGLAPTKTLAKVANHIAKKDSVYGVCDIRQKEVQDDVLKKFKIEDIWGVGRKLSQRFRLLGIDTAYKLRSVDGQWIRKYYSVIGQRMIMELNGFSCLGTEDIKPNKTIISSRSFGKYVEDKDSLTEAVSSYIARAAEKMRKQGSKAMGLHVYIRTNRFSKFEKQYRGDASIGFDAPTSYTPKMIDAGLKCLDQIYKSGYKYKKAGIMLFNLVADDYKQNDFFAKHDGMKHEKLMEVVDGINNSIKKGIVAVAAQGTKKEWGNKSECRTPRYTTNWNELLNIGC